MGRAIALSVIAFFLAGVGWVFFLELLLFQLMTNRWNGWVERHQWLAECLAAECCPGSGSPLTRQAQSS